MDDAAAADGGVYLWLLRWGGVMMRMHLTAEANHTLFYFLDFLNFFICYKVLIE